MSNPSIEAAGRWLAAEAHPPHPIFPALRRRFHLSVKQAVDAIRIANELRRAA